jgi:hypothetical protein
MKYASSSSSDTSIHVTDELSIASIHFWTSQASREPPTIAHADSWTPTMITGRSCIHYLVGSDEDTADQCNWDQCSTEPQHLNSLTGRCTDPDAASHIFTSHNFVPRPTMNSQFATLIDILGPPMLRDQEPPPSDDALTTLSHHSPAPDSSAEHPRPVSHWDWQEEESSVSSSFTNASSETSTSATERISSSSFELSPGERDQPLTVSATSPLHLALSRLQEIFPRPPTHNSAGLFTVLTVEEGVSGSTNTHGIQPDP